MAEGVRSEEDRHYNNKTLAAAIDAAPIAIVCLDAERRVTVFNAAAELVFKCRAADAMGHTAARVGLGTAIGDELHFPRVLAGETFRDMAAEHRHRDRRLIALRVAAAPMRDRAGAIMGVAYAVEEVTEQRKLEAAHSIQQRIFETSLDLLLVVDRQGNFIQVSPSSMALLGYAPEEMIGRSAIEFLHSGDLENTRREMRLARRGRLLRNFECRYVHKQQRIVPLAWTGVWSEPEQQHFFIGRDMTERQKLELQLHQAQKMEALGQLTGGMSHDFNNLLGIIVGNLDLLQERVKADQEAVEILSEAVEAALRGADLNRRLLAFARRQPLQPKRTNINELIASVAKMLGRTLGEHIEIKLSAAADLWPAAVDPAQLESSLTNLAVNARDAMLDGGSLTIATRNTALDEDYVIEHPDVIAGEYALIEVTDSGTGMPPEVLRRVFEPFFTTKEIGRGTGLGLSMVFGFIKQSGGHLQIYSELGSGTTVRLYLPRAPEEIESDAVPRIEPAVLPKGNEKVLVVEDNEMLRRVLVRQLTGLGYTVQYAANAKVALELLQSDGEYDLLFTDIMMPGGMSGWELAEAAAKLRPQLRTLFTSGFPEAALAENGILTEGTLLLSKPYRKQELAERIREALMS